MKNVGNNSRGRSQEVPKIFRAPMYRAHCAVIFAIAQLSCLSLTLTDSHKCLVFTYFINYVTLTHFVYEYARTYKQ